MNFSFWLKQPMMTFKEFCLKNLSFRSLPISHQKQPSTGMSVFFSSIVHLKFLARLYDIFMNIRQENIEAIWLLLNLFLWSCASMLHQTYYEEGGTLASILYSTILWHCSKRIDYLLGVKLIYAGVQERLACFFASFTFFWEPWRVWSSIQFFGCQIYAYQLLLLYLLSVMRHGW